MSAEHLSPEELQSFVDGSSDPATEQRLSVHVRKCSACAAALSNAAKLEEQLYEVAAARGWAPNRARTFRRATRVLVPLAIAASLLYALVLRPRAIVVNEPELTAAAIPAVICPDGPDQRQCVREAHARGLIVSYPATASGPAIGAATIQGSEWSFE
ncbi:MAG: hypothetical protein ACJ790_01055 [Myxococcaceae bacterium]